MIGILFQNEKALREYVCKKLVEGNYEIIGTEATVYGGKRIDVMARNVENKTVAIEVKRFNRIGIADDIRKLERLGFLPEIDLFYVAVPKMNLQGDMLGFAKKLGVGVIGITEEGLEWLVDSDEKSPVALYKSTDLPNIVIPGREFQFQIFVKNNGGKMARNIEIMYMPAWPFRVPKGEKNHKFIKELMPGKQKQISFKIKVKNDAEEGRHPLFSRMTLPGTQAVDSLYHLEVRKEVK
ncbi:hypothetical protein KAU88_06615 [Candidatus Bathyarchaeota archaeon]|nr:hypothetical protein [Candidatus Bathyarchaeota archaeon]